MTIGGIAGGVLCIGWNWIVVVGLLTLGHLGLPLKQKVLRARNKMLGRKCTVLGIMNVLQADGHLD